MKEREEKSSLSCRERERWVLEWIFWTEVEFLFFLIRIALAVGALFWFHINFKTVFSNSVKNVNGSLMGMALNL